VNHFSVARCVLVVILAWPFLTPVLFAEEADKGKEKPPANDGEKVPKAKLDAAELARLVKQLQSFDFKTREKAAQELTKLEDVPAILREVAKSSDVDLEARRRAQAIIDAITERLEEKAFQAMVADLSTIELDRFVRRMITDKKFAGANQWKVIEAVTKAVTKRANDLAGNKYPVPNFDVKSMPIANLADEGVGFAGKRFLLSDPNTQITSVNDSIVLCTGFRPWITSVENSIVIVDGEFAGATGLDNSLLIVSGKLGRFTGISRSIILVNGEFGVKEMFMQDGALRGATGCDSSFVQCKNEKIRFTSSHDCVFIKTIPVPGRTSRVLDTDKGPLQLLRFSSPKSIADDKLAWGKTVNGLALAVFPTERTNNYLLRWKNVGKETLELQCVRSRWDPLQNDDLLHHVFVKDQGGKLVPARQPTIRFAGGAPRRPGGVILPPGKSHEETIDLLSYVEKPAAPGRFTLSIELDISPFLAPAPSQKGAVYWTGKIQSNELEITFGK
jgi:hypothetical protein